MWTQLRNRRLINYGGHPTAKGMIAEVIPAHIQKCVDKVNDTEGIFNEIKANHVLLNEYKRGEGIFSHFDGPLFYPTISTLSLGSHTVLEFNKPPKDDNYETSTEFKLLVERRSLLVLKDEMYNSYMHSIMEVDKDDITDEKILNLSRTSFKESIEKIIERETRYSLTIRHVPRTSKLKLKFFK